MPSLRSIANQYHEAANRIAARADRVGELTENQRKAIESFRDCAAKVEALIRPEDSERKQDIIEVQADVTPVEGPKKAKAHKAATPQELLEMANG
jgi:hypothetical protein